MGTARTPKVTYSYTMNSPARAFLAHRPWPQRHWSHQHNVYLALIVLPPGVIRFVVLPIVVELDDVCVALRRVLFRNVVHVFVLFSRGEGHGKQSGRQATQGVIGIALLKGGSERSNTRITRNMACSPRVLSSYLVPKMLQKCSTIRITPVFPSVTSALDHRTAESFAPIGDASFLKLSGWSLSRNLIFNTCLSPVI